MYGFRQKVLVSRRAIIPRIFLTLGYYRDYEAEKGASLDLRKIGQETGRASRTGQRPAVSTYYVGKATFTGSVSLSYRSSAVKPPIVSKYKLAKIGL